VTDFNLLKLCLVCEDLSPLLAGCLYANKLELFIKHPRVQNFDFYQFLDKDTLEEMMEDEDNIRKINANFMK